MTSTTTLARRYLQLRDELEVLKLAYEAAEDLLKDALSDETSITVDGRTISLVESKRRAFDVDLLRELVSVSVFRRVTVPAVKPLLFDAAVTMGNIDHDVIDQITTVTTYSQLRVK